MRADGSDGQAKVVGAVVVVSRAPQTAIAEEVAGGDQGVVDAGRRVLDQRQDRAAAVGEERVANTWRDASETGADVLPREEFGWVGGGEGPEVANLGAVGVEDGQALCGGEADGAPLAGTI